MEEIKKLRARTGAGMVECKKALDEVAGDLNKAIELLRKKGIAKAAKRSDRQANEGIIKIKLNDDKQKGYLLELNSETDFVARNEKFQALAEQIINLAKEKEVDNQEQLMSLPLAEGTVSEALDNLSGTIGEKMTISRLASLSGATVAAYSHLGGKIAVLVALDQADQLDLGVEIAMQVAATNPKYLNRQEVRAEEIQSEKAIYREQLKKAGKPDQILDKIVEAKMEKYYGEVCLLEQEYIKDEDKKIKDILAGVNILGFIRFSLQ